MCRQISSLLSGSNLSRVLGASLLLCIYVSVVLLSFTHHSKQALQLTANGAVVNPMFDRTYVTTIWSERQLPSLITLAHSLMQQQSQYGLLVLMPSGKQQRSPPVKNRMRKGNAASRRSRSGKSTSNDHTSSVPGVGSDVTDPNEGGAEGWSEDSMTLLRAVPNLTIQLLPHIQFPREKLDATKRHTHSSTASGTSSEPTVSFASAVSTLLMFEVWRLTSYKQLLYLDVQTALHGNIDYLLREDFSQTVAAVAQPSNLDGSGHEHTHATHEAAAHPDAAVHFDPVRRAQIIDSSVERWLHHHSIKERIHMDANPPSGGIPGTSTFGTSHLEPIEWQETHASLTPTYLQLAAPIHLSRDDCSQFDEIQRRASNKNADLDAHSLSKSAGSSGSAGVFATTLHWSLFGGGVLLLTPNSYTYHLLLSHYTHTHVERRDRFDSNAMAKKLRQEKFGDYRSNFLNHFFSEPCAHSTEGHHNHQHSVGTHTTPNPAANVHDSPLTTSESGCWHPLPLNYSLTSHTCSCESQQTFDDISTYASCDRAYNVWNALPASVTDTLRRYDQLTIRVTDPAVTPSSTNTRGKKKLALPETSAAKTATSIPSASHSSASSSSYYSQLLSSLSWILNDSTDRRFALIYLKEAEEQAMATLDEWANNGQSSADTSNSTTLTPPVRGPTTPPLSGCCRAKYRSVLKMYFEALQYIRPTFDATSGRKTNH